MTKVRHIWLNIAAFLLPLVAGYIALNDDAFLFLAFFILSTFASLFPASTKVKAAARSSLMGFLFGFIALFILLINSDLS